MGWRKKSSSIMRFYHKIPKSSMYFMNIIIPGLFSDQPSGSGCSGTGYFEVDNSKTWSKTIYLSYRSSRSCWWYIYNPNPKRQMVLTVDDFHVSHLILGNCMANWKGENRIYFSFFLSTYLENIKLFFWCRKMTLYIQNSTNIKDPSLS